MPAILSECAGHARHGPDPAEALKVDRGHGVHFPGSPVNPEGQMLRQSDGAPLPLAESFPLSHPWHVDANVAPRTVENLPASHSIQGSVPKLDLNLPAVQSEQRPGPIFVEPALQAQSMAPAAEEE